MERAVLPKEPASRDGPAPGKAAERDATHPASSRRGNVTLQACDMCKKKKAKVGYWSFHFTIAIVLIFAMHSYVLIP